jgi:hypothetical protein
MMGLDGIPIEVSVTPRVNRALNIFIKTLIKDLIKWFIPF